MIPASKVPEAAALRDIEVRPIQWQHPGISPVTGDVRVSYILLAQSSWW